MPHRRWSYTRVRLDYQGYFLCPECRWSRPHPPRDIFLEYYSIGYAFCPVCLETYLIAGGDKLGIVEIDERGELRTRLFSEEERAERKRAEEEARLKLAKIKGG
ncbi:MAG TPA: hypothetical protein VGB73_10860 [Pyrinomonadaceae bacterium]|jgi:hypothetical protein